MLRNREGKMRKKCRDIIQKRWILIWALLSVIYAGIIHILFSVTAQNRFWKANWGAGDILTYVSTVSLGLLALWQNKKQQEENDKSQHNLENIIVHSNELRIVSKIIEHEERRISELNERLIQFMQYCDPQAFAIVLKPEDELTCMINLAELERKIDQEFFMSSRLLCEDKKLQADDDDPFKSSFGILYSFAKRVINMIRTNQLDTSDVSAMKCMAKSLGKIRDKFMIEKQKYLETQEEKLRGILFENLSLEEIRELYK